MRLKGILQGKICLRQNLGAFLKVLTKAQVFAIILVVCGGLVLLGWQFYIPVLKGDFAQSSIIPNTALLFILSGLALFTSGSKVRFGRYVNYFCAAFVVVFAVLTLGEYALHRSFGIDSLFFAHRLNEWRAAP
ncbi:MAG: hypothetical protein ACJ73N_09160, partial [Bryobacteraceae bacterium]